MLQPGDGDPDSAYLSVISTLSKPWATGVLGQGGSARLAAVVVAVDDRRSITLDGNGVIGEWDNGSLDARWRRQVLAPSDQPLQYLDADPDLRTLVMETANTVHIVDAGFWRDTTVALSAFPRHTAFAPADHYVAVDADGLRLVGTDGVLRDAPVEGTVLDLRQQDDGTVRALVRRGDTLEVIDPRTGAVTASSIRPGHEFEKGALSRDGGVAWIGPDHQIYLARRGLDLRPTGQVVPDVLDVLRPMSGGRIVFGGAQFGIRIYDDRVHAEVGLICRSESGVDAVAFSPREDVVACVDNFTVELWRTRALSPTTLPPPPETVLGRTARTTSSGFDVDGRPDGVLAVTPHGPGKQVTFHLSATPYTAVAAGDSWIVAGTASGFVAQFSVKDGVVVETGTWQVPSGAPVTAIGPDPADSDLVLVGTRDGLWWTAPSCLDCATIGGVVDHVKRRLWGCYTDNQLELLGTEVRQLLGVRICPAQPEIIR